MRLRDRNRAPVIRVIGRRDLRRQPPREGETRERGCGSVTWPVFQTRAQSECPFLMDATVDNSKSSVVAPCNDD